MFAGFPSWSAAGITRACCLLFEKSISRPPLEFATMLVQELGKKGKKQQEPKRVQRRGQTRNARHKAQGSSVDSGGHLTLDTLKKDSSILN
jgi:hypothetical protein